MSSNDSNGARDGLDADERRVRDALRAQADTVEPAGNGLDEIRSGIAGGRAPRAMPWWRHRGAPAMAAAAAVLLVAGGIAITGNGGSNNVAVVPGGGSSGTGSASPSVSATATDQPLSSSPPPTAATDKPLPVEGDVTVYYTSRDGDTTRLYAERKPNIGMDPVTMALTDLFGEKPADPDYSSPWQGYTLTVVTVTAGVATVEVDKAPPAGIALQQLVYTVTANDPSVEGVWITYPGEAARDPKPVSRAPEVDVLGFIQLSSPAEGSTVTSPVTIAGTGTAFEGTMSYDILPGGDGATGNDQSTISAGSMTTGANGEFADFSATSVDLDPGTYVIRAFEASAKDGSPIHVDSKTFTVK